MSRPLPLHNRPAWFHDEGRHMLELPSDPAVRIGDLAGLLLMELGEASVAEVTANRATLDELLLVLWRRAAERAR